MLDNPKFKLPRFKLEVHQLRYDGTIGRLKLVSMKLGA